MIIKISKYPNILNLSFSLQKVKTLEILICAYPTPDKAFIPRLNLLQFM